VANRYLPEDPSSWGPSERDIEEFPYKDRGRKPPALADWQKFAAPWQKRAEERGFADPFAMIGRDIAAAEHDQRMRETEARMQAEIEREIGVPASAPPAGHAGPARAYPRMANRIGCRRRRPCSATTPNERTRIQMRSRTGTTRLRRTSGRKIAMPATKTREL